MPVCRVDGCEDHYGCRLRAKGVAVAPSAMPSRRNTVPPRRADPAWERGVAGEHRPGGGFMPFLGDDGKPMPVKEHGERRTEVAGRVKRLKSDPNVFAASAAP